MEGAPALVLEERGDDRAIRREAGVPVGTVDLSWIPLGAGNASVRGNGIVYEAVTATIQRRPRRELFHSALVIELPGGRFSVEMTPIPDGRGHERGVVAEGPVGTRWAGRLRVFRYEIRRWCDGVIPDLGYAVASPVRITEDPLLVQRTFEALPLVPTLTWGRDELRTGDMWSCNSVISWALTRAGVDTPAIALPPHGRAPGWDAGIEIALRGVEGPAHRRAA